MSSSNDFLPVFGNSPSHFPAPIPYGDVRPGHPVPAPCACGSPAGGPGHKPLGGFSWITRSQARRRARPPRGASCRWRAKRCGSWARGRCATRWAARSTPGARQTAVIHKTGPGSALPRTTTTARTPRPPAATRTPAWEKPASARRPRSVTLPADDMPRARRDGLPPGASPFHTASARRGTAPPSPASA